MYNDINYIIFVELELPVESLYWDQTFKILIIEFNIEFHEECSVLKGFFK